MNNNYRILLEFDTNKNLIVKVINTLNNKLERKISGRQAYQFINEISKTTPIKNIYYNRENDYIKVEYKDEDFYIVVKNTISFDENKNKLQAFITAVENHLKNNKCITTGKPKVTRKNKYGKQKIYWKPVTKIICILISGIMTISLLASMTKGLEEKNKEVIEPYEMSETMDEPSQTEEAIEIFSDESFESESETSKAEEPTKAIACFDYIDNTSSKKAVDCKNNYYELICKYCKTYGVDPNVILAMATQERGYHSETPDKYATGLMQISYKACAGTDKSGNVNPSASVKCYNFETGKMDTVTFTAKSICNLEENIKVGVMLFRYTYDNYSKHNILLAVQTYNSGCGRMKGIIQNVYVCNYLEQDDSKERIYTYGEFVDKCETFLYRINNNEKLNNVDINKIIKNIEPQENNEYTFDNLIEAYTQIVYANQENTTWIDRDLLSGYDGKVCKSCDDPLYMEHVFQYFPNDVSTITMIERVKDSDGNYISSTYNADNYDENTINISSTKNLVNTKIIN